MGEGSSMKKKKKISIMVPTYNEEDNVVAMHKALTDLMGTELSQYEYEILFIDNKSTDTTRALIRAICQTDKQVKAIFNARNFGQFNSPYYGLIQSDGDCTISLCADFQDPLDMIPRFVAEWEKGYRIVCGVKTKSRVNPFEHFLRSCYYKLIRKSSNVEIIEQFTGFGLYDNSFIEVLRHLDDPTPFYRGLVAELGFDRKIIEYTQQKRRAGKSSNNLFTLYDAAMLSFTSYTKIGLRLPTVVGFLLAGLSLIIALGYLIAKLIWWYSFPAGIAPIIISVFFFGSVQLFFIGILGEYVLAINERLKHRPLVVEEERLNYD
jgi:glycosyltransferase involved in cell wall biosynthesis